MCEKAQTNLFVGYQTDKEEKRREEKNKEKEKEKQKGTVPKDLRYLRDFGLVSSATNMDRTIWDEIFIKLLPLSSCPEASDVRGYKPKITLE